MTVSIRIANVGNTEDDKVALEWRTNPDSDWTPLHDGQWLHRGEVTRKLGLSATPGTEFRITGIHGDGKYIGEVDLVTDDRDYHKGDYPAPGTFGWAIFMLKRGHRVMRLGWNGKGMWLWLHPGIEGCSEHKGEPSKPFITMRTAQGDMQPGWLASQPDMLADDWELVE